MRRKIVVFPIAFFIFFLLISASPSVLYAAQLPPTSEGPGFILPDSPLYFLDKIKQDVRVALALTHQSKAQVYNSIAGERIAELRFMLNKKNARGIEIALKGVEENTRLSADSLAEAQFQGQDVEKLAESLNTDINRRQEGLDVLLSQADGELKSAVLGTQTSIYDSKTKVVNGLAPEKRASEASNNQNKQIETNIAGGNMCSPGMLNNLANLKRKIEEASTRKLDERKMDLEKATSSAKEIKLITNEEKKKLLTSAYERLEKAAKQCVEAYSAFTSAYREFNNLLNVRTNQQAPGSSVNKK